MRSRLKSTDLADLLSVPKLTIEKWVNNGYLTPSNRDNGTYIFDLKNLMKIQVISQMVNSRWVEQEQETPARNYKAIELFAGAGGLALGLESAGFHSVLLNEIDKSACETLKHNRPKWNVIEGDIKDIDFKKYEGKVDLVSGGFPCQAFSYAGKKMGFEDTRGTLFHEMGRAIKETSPPVFLAENVKGLLRHDKGRTIDVIKEVIGELGYRLIEPRVLKAMQYKVPQKRERLILIGIRKDIEVDFEWPDPYYDVLTLRDALYKGPLYDCDVPISIGQQYPKRKREIMELVPMGGYWKSLPIEIQKEYMKKSFYMGGGKTGMARRLSLDEPSLTLTCAPAQKQTERCHPLETRPLSVREYARIQTFPDDWDFQGSLTNKYKQIGNAVPVNLAAAIARSIVRFLNKIEIENTTNHCAD